MAKNDYKMEENELILTIQPMTKAEISLVPRYVEEDLYNFINQIKEKHNITIKNEVLPQIEIGTGILNKRRQKGRKRLSK